MASIFAIYAAASVWSVAPEKCEAVVSLLPVVGHPRSLTTPVLYSLVGIDVASRASFDGNPRFSCDGGVGYRERIIR